MSSTVKTIFLTIFCGCLIGNVIYEGAEWAMSPPAAKAQTVTSGLPGLSQDFNPVGVYNGAGQRPDSSGTTTRPLDYSDAGRFYNDAGKWPNSVDIRAVWLEKGQLVVEKRDDRTLSNISLLVWCGDKPCPPPPPHIWREYYAAVDGQVKLTRTVDAIVSPAQDMRVEWPEEKAKPKK